jgi:hypothetical protein
MKRWSVVSSVVCSVVVFASLGAGCSGGTGPAKPTFDPFGTGEPTVGADDPPSAAGNGDQAPPSAASIPQLCAQACSHIAASCPQATDSTCVANCSNLNPMGCDAEVRTFIACIATAPLTCDSTGNVTATSCTPAENAVSACINSMQGTGTAGGGI